MWSQHDEQRYRGLANTFGELSRSYVQPKVDGVSFRVEQRTNNGGIPSRLGLIARHGTRSLTTMQRWPASYL